MEAPSSLAEWQDAVRDLPRVIPVGGGTKPALHDVPADYHRLSLLALAGITEYEPSEYTLTAWAGTLLRDLAEALRAHGQYMPFDPPFVASGATLGGMVAAGLNGPGSYRFGGIRDFILAVQFINGQGRLLQGGAKVVKNAAGFDLPKFLTGSLGRFGVITQVTLKTFPEPPAQATLRIPCQTLAQATERIAQLAGGPWECECLDFEPSAMHVVVRLRGQANALPTRIERMRAALGWACEVLGSEGAQRYWHGRNEFFWATESLAKIPITLRDLPEMEECFGHARRIYSIAGNVAWVDSPDSAPAWTRPWLAIRGGRINPLPPASILAALQRVFDPAGRFPPV